MFLLINIIINIFVEKITQRRTEDTTTTDDPQQQKFVLIIKPNEYIPVKQYVETPDKTITHCTRNPLVPETFHGLRNLEQRRMRLVALLVGQ